MIEWVLDTRYAHLHCSEPPVEFTLRAIGSAAEGDLLELMEQVLADHPAVKLSSLPFRGDDTRPRHIEFGIKGPRAAAAMAFADLQRGLAQRRDLSIELLRAP
jgi:molybdopterin-biosynthesis enzyme MoeA-like protein